MNIKECPVCGAKWMDDQLYWSTGKKGKNEDLNALVCRNLPPEKAKNCINPGKGGDGGVGWFERAAMMEKDLLSQTEEGGTAP